jgi:DNA-binding PadR family transcriptional regulator
MTQGPLREPTFLVLTALAAQPQHGYGIIEDVRTISDGRVKLQAGTLYGVLDRLRADGLVEVEREEVVSSRLRRYYRLTGAGARLLSAETERMRRNADAAADRLRAFRPAPSGGAA